MEEVVRRRAPLAGSTDRRRANQRRHLRRVVHTEERPVPPWLRAVLSIPLELKLLGANLIIVFVAALLLFGPIRLDPSRPAHAFVMMTSLLVASAMSFVVLRLALRPIASLAQVAWLVSEGLLGARVPASIIADRELMQVTTTINDLLDNLVAERDRMAKLEAMPATGTLR